MQWAINEARKYTSRVIAFLDHAPAPGSARSAAVDLEAWQLSQRRPQAAAVPAGDLEPHPRAGEPPRHVAARPFRPSAAHHPGRPGGASPCRADDWAGGEFSRAL